VPFVKTASWTLNFNGSLPYLLPQEEVMTFCSISWGPIARDQGFPLGQPKPSAPIRGHNSDNKARGIGGL